MKIEFHKGCKIKSTPFSLTDEGDYKYSTNGIIEINSGNSITNIMVSELNISDSEWKHRSEEDADIVFIKYAKLFIDTNIHYT